MKYPLSASGKTWPVSASRKVRPVQGCRAHEGDRQEAEMPPVTGNAQPRDANSLERNGKQLPAPAALYLALHFFASSFSLLHGTKMPVEDWEAFCQADGKHL